MSNPGKTKDDKMMVQDCDESNLIYTLNNILDRLTKLEKV
jgi:hypothetical protein